MSPKKPPTPRGGGQRCPTCNSFVHHTGDGGVSCKACGWKGKVL